MKEVVKICSKHGELSKSQTYEESMNNGLTFRLRCRQCRSEYYLKTNEKRKAYSKDYEKNKRKRPKTHYENYAKVKSREWRREHKDLVNSRVAADREKDPEKYREYDRKWRAENRTKIRELDIIKRHNISYDEYKWMMEKQDGKCYICNKEETRKSRTSGHICRLVIDHNHATGKIRKLLCHNCNVVVGHCKESVEFLQKTIDYLKEHEHIM